MAALILGAASPGFPMSSVPDSKIENACLPGTAVERVQAALVEYRPALEYIAGFLTRSPELAEACVEDAAQTLQSQGLLDENTLERCVRRLTIDSAIDAVQIRIAQLSPAYPGSSSCGGVHAPLPPEAIELLIDQAWAIGLRLDSLCRAALVLRGVENVPLEAAALRLGIRADAIEAAYCRALRILDDIVLEIAIDDYDPTTTVN